MTTGLLRVVSLTVPGLVAACASAPHASPAVAPAAVWGIEGPAVDLAAPATPAAAPIGDGIGKSYTIGKVGTFMPSGDLENLDDGFYVEAIFGRALLPFLAIEGQIGYLTADGRFGPTEIDVWAVPLFVNARVSLPVLFFEPYAGVGVGGVYADYDAGALFSSNDFVLAYDAFVGLEVGLGRLAVGAEYKYLQTEDTKNDFSIEGGTASLFVSLPF